MWSLELAERHPRGTLTLPLVMYIYTQPAASVHVRVSVYANIILVGVVCEQLCMRKAYVQGSYAHTHTV